MTHVSFVSIFVDSDKYASLNGKLIIRKIVLTTKSTTWIDVAVILPVHHTSTI